MSGKTTRVAPDPTHGHTLTAGGEADCRRGEAVCRRAARCARFVLLASVLTLLCAAHGLFVVAVRAQTPVATPTPARQQTRPPGGEQNQP
ncbi:MAG: hypothetical protein M3444_23690, partial [Acidobacteriota bacterium]|nr:hypothetical protein [Acidobacteriota bacterium]